MPKNDFQKKLMVLQGEMMEATLKGDKDKYEKFNNEYNLLMDQLTGLLFGKRKRNPLNLLKEIISDGPEINVPFDKLETNQLYLCDSIYHGEGYLFDKIMSINGVRYIFDEEREIINVVIIDVANKVNKSKTNYSYVNSPSADSGTILLLSRIIDNEIDSKKIKRYICSQEASNYITKIGVEGYSGLVISPHNGSSGYDLYIKSGNILIDFSRVRDDEIILRQAR